MKFCKISADITKIAKLLMLASSAFLVVFILYLIFSVDLTAGLGFLLIWQLWAVKYYYCRYRGWSSLYWYVYTKSDGSTPSLHGNDFLIMFPQLLVIVIIANKLY
jgi:hypothetical protein